MKLTLIIFPLLLSALLSNAQWSITSLNETGDTIDFTTTIVGVNNGGYTGSGLVSTPGYGLLDSDGWKITGMSDGSSHFGGTFTSGDFARGTSTGGSSTGGAYAFVVGSGDTALGVQPIASDWTPGEIILMVINNTGDTADSFTLSYDLYINNDQGRANSFNCSYSINDSNNFTSIPELNDSSIATSQGSVQWVAYQKLITISETLLDGDTLFIAWDGDDLSGSGSRDEFALDNISVVLHGPPTSLPLYSISTVTTIDANGLADSLGVECAIKGIALGIDMDANEGYSFTLWDGDGIHIVSPIDISGYQMEEGDSLLLYGTIGQFNGLIQFEVDSGALLDSGVAIPNPTLVTSLSEATESELIRIENFWVDTAIGLSYTLSNGTQSIVMEIDSATDIVGNLELNIGDTLCFVIGIGSQFDNTNPYTEGYRFFPQRLADIDNSCGSIPPPVIPFYPISAINNVNASGVADSLGLYCWTKGVVLGVDLDGNSGLSFTLWDEEGVNAYSGIDVNNYVVEQGDSLIVRGTIDQFNGLTEIVIDSIELLNSGNSVPSPMLVDALSEESESEYITIRNVRVIDRSTWNTAFTSNIKLLTCNGDTIVMRLDTDTEVDENVPNAPTGYFHLTGIGGQFDPTSPFTDGYQIFPMFYTDIDSNTGPTTGLQLLINEVMTENATSAMDAAGDYDDWVEIKNIGTGTSSLSGLYLTNEAGNPAKYMIPTTSSESIPAGAYGLVWCDNEPAEGDLHTNFTLDNAGDYFGIYQEVGCDMEVVDELTIPALSVDESYGYYPEGTDTLVVFNTLSTTPGMMNMLIPVGLNPFDENGQLVIYPNPAHSHQIIRFNQNIDYAVFDLLGNQIKNEKNAQTLATSDLSTGTYLLRTSNGEVLRFVIH